MLTAVPSPADEAAPGHLLLAAGRRRRRAAAAEARDAPPRRYGIETHVLAPDDPKWVHEDAELAPRARPGCTAPATSGRGRRMRPASRCAVRRAMLVPDESVPLERDRDPRRDPDRARRGDRRHPHDLAARLRASRGRRREERARRAVGGRPPRLARRPPSPPHREPARAAKERVGAGVAHLVARRADAIVAVSDAIADEARAPRARAAPSRPSRTAATSTTSPGSSTSRRTASGSRTRAASSGSATRGRSSLRCRVGPRRCRRALRRRLPGRRPRVGGAARLGDRLELVPTSRGGAR